MRALYQEELGAQATTRNAAGGRDRGANVIGDKPTKSPGDTSDLPPTGEDLLEMEDEKKPRIDKFRTKFYDELEDVAETAKEEADAMHNLLEHPPPGRPEVAVNAGPAIGPEVPQHASVDAGAVAEMLVVAGVIGYQAGRWLDHKLGKLLRR